MSDDRDAFAREYARIGYRPGERWPAPPEPLTPAAGGVMPHGKICYLEIPANRAEDSARFYSDIFGWTVRERGDGNLAFDDTGGVSGTWVKEADRTPDERTRTYIMVDSITESLGRIQKAGGRVVTPRTDIGPSMGAFAAFTDPVGNEFGLYEEPQR
jgi:predicted enzyme related to lactoylglutathione lyase